MSRFRKFLPSMMAALIGVGILGAPSKAQAAFTLFLQQAGVNSGNITAVASGPDFTPLNFSGNYGNFTVTFLGATSTNGNTLSSLLSSTTSVTNNDLTAAHTLRLWVSQTNYTLPGGTQLNVESGMGGTVNIGVLGPLGVFQAFADRNNNLLAAGTLTGGGATADFTNGPQNASQVGSTFDTGSAVGLFTRNGPNAPYSLTSEATLTMSAGGNVNYANHINVTATPAPAGIVLALTGVPCAVGAWLRRRKGETQVS